MNTNPKFDPSRSHGTIYGGSGIPGEREARFTQDGHNFAADGTYLSSEPGARKPAPVAEPPRRVASEMPLPDEAEMELLLQDPNADDLLAMDREVIVEMVKHAGGHVVSGDGSQRLMAAWLIKYTMAPGPELLEVDANRALIPEGSGQARGEEGASGEQLPEGAETSEAAGGAADDPAADSTGAPNAT